MFTIDRFKDGYHFLSNFEDSQVWMDNVLYETVEHAYQAAKTTDDDEREEIRCAPTPGKAKRLGKAVEKSQYFRKNWLEIRVKIMEDLVRQKFENPRLRQMLLDTKDHDLMEGNAHKDDFWGCVQENGKWVGENNLGKILMKVRDEIRNPKPV